MSTPAQMSMFLSSISMQLPIFLVCLIACIVILSKWEQGASGSLWALSGFGLVLALCIIMPIVQTIIQGWIFQGGQRAERLWILGAFSLFSSVLHAAAYGLLLVAVFAGRPARN